MKGLVILNTKKCTKCGTEINGTHHKPPFYQKKLPKGFYGNNIKKTIISVCDCGEKYLSLLRPARNSYDIVTLAKMENVTDVPENMEAVPDKVAVVPDKDINVPEKVEVKPKREPAKVTPPKGKAGLLDGYEEAGNFAPEIEEKPLKIPDLGLEEDEIDMKKATKAFDEKKYRAMNRVELEQVCKEMDIKGNIYIMKDETLIKKLLNL